MANVLAPFGFTYRGIMGATPNVETREHAIAAADTTKTYQGDPVKSLTTGYIAQWTATTAVSQLAGIFVGCYLNSTTGRFEWSPFWPGGGNSGDGVAYIIACSGAIPRCSVCSRAAPPSGVLTSAPTPDVPIGTSSTVTGTLDQATLGITKSLVVTGDER